MLQPVPGNPAALALVDGVVHGLGVFDSVGQVSVLGIRTYDAKAQNRQA
jgi:hypothetical protein